MKGEDEKGILAGAVEQGGCNDCLTHPAVPGEAGGGLEEGWRKEGEG